jgi:hypothetical protein
MICKLLALAIVAWIAKQVIDGMSWIKFGPEDSDP